MKRYISLSWELNESTPLYPGTPNISITPIKRIQGGDSCNTCQLAMSGHTGTHIDFPRHFYQDGCSFSDYGPEDLIFRQVVVLDCRKEAGEIIGVEDVRFLARSTDTAVDLLLIKTSFSKYRKSDSERYITQNPCIAPEAAMWLREHFPGVRGFGIDCISVSSPMHRELGRETHRILLDFKLGEALSPVIIEDLYLPDNQDNFDEVIVAALPVQDADGVPCVVLGVVNA